MSLNKASPEDPALELHEFTTLLSSYKLNGITKVRRLGVLFMASPDPCYLQADLSAIAAFFRNSQSGMVHLSAVKQEFQLEIQPLPIMSKTVRASFCLWSTLILQRSLLYSAIFLECCTGLSKSMRSTFTMAGLPSE